MNEQLTVQPRVAAMTPGDQPAVNAFIERVPRGEYLFLKEDIGRPEVIDGWRTRGGCQVLIAYVGEEVAGLLAVIAALGWSAHVGDCGWWSTRNGADAVSAPRWLVAACASPSNRGWSR